MLHRLVIYFKSTGNDTGSNTGSDKNILAANIIFGFIILLNFKQSSQEDELTELNNDTIKLFVITILIFSSSCFFTRMAFMIEKKRREGKNFSTIRIILQFNPKKFASVKVGYFLAADASEYWPLLRSNTL